MGDELKSSDATFTARVLGVPPQSEPRILLVLRDGLVIDARPVTEEDFTYTFTASEPGNYRLQLQRGSAIEALTNPITLEAR